MERTAVAVIHPLPAYRHGIAAVLDPDRYRYEDPEGCGRWEEWLATLGSKVALVCVDRPDSWSQLDAAIADPDTTVIALLPDTGAPAYAQVLRRQVDGVVAAECPPEAITHVIEAAQRGQILLPSEIACSIADAARFDTDLTPGDIRLLYALAESSSLGDIAHTLHLSPRTVRRRLADMYARLGAHNPAEALAHARGIGLIP